MGPPDDPVGYVLFGVLSIYVVAGIIEDIYNKYRKYKKFP